MKLLFITQKVDKDDDVLGFTHSWIAECARHAETVTVICLFEGPHILPANVRVLSLGKEYRQSRLRYLWCFFSFIIQERSAYDTVFVHMNPIYVVLGGLFWKLSGKRIGLWYTHRQVDTKLRIAEHLTDVVFTASAESFRLPSQKLHIMGHGIEVERFRPHDAVPPAVRRDGLRLVSVGRITPIKNLDTLIEALAILVRGGVDARLALVGAPGPSENDQAYHARLLRMIADHNLGERVTWTGSIPNTEIAPLYWSADISVNLCPTGGVDKAVLESMSAGLPVIVSNKTFSSYFGVYADRLMFQERNADEAAAKIAALAHAQDRQELIRYLEEKVRQTSDVRALIARMLTLLRHGPSN